MCINNRIPKKFLKNEEYSPQKKPAHDGWLFLKMAGPTRLELATSGVTGRRSNQLNYDPAVVLFEAGSLPEENLPYKRNDFEPGFPPCFEGKNGGLNRARTCDPRLVRPMLSQLSYQPKFFLSGRETLKKKVEV